MRYEWPGNVRELENAIQRGMVLTQGKYVESDHLPERLLLGTAEIFHPSIGADTEDNLSLKVAKKELEVHLIKKALIRCDGNKSKAASVLELSYPSLLGKIKMYGL